jgi:hypothetical protein
MLSSSCAKACSLGKLCRCKATVWMTQVVPISRAKKHATARRLNGYRREVTEASENLSQSKTNKEFCYPTKDLSRPQNSSAKYSPT